MKKNKEEIWKKLYAYSPVDQSKLLNSKRVKKLSKVFASQKFNKILDIGCADGTISVALKKISKTDEVCGVDLSEEAIFQAKRKGVKAYTLDVDVNSLPFDDGYFDAAYAGELIEHLFDPDHLLDEVYRVLRQGGIFVVTTPNLSSLINRLLLLFGFQPILTEVSLKYHVGAPRIRRKIMPKRMRKSRASGHIRSFTHCSLLELLELHGFYVEESMGCEIPWPISFPLNILDKIGLCRVSLSSIVIFVCRKR